MHWNRSVFVAAFVSIPLAVANAVKPERNSPRKGVEASFSLDATAHGPFPSDRFTSEGRNPLSNVTEEGVHDLGCEPERTRNFLSGAPVPGRGLRFLDDDHDTVRFEAERVALAQRHLVRCAKSAQPDLDDR